MTWTCPECLSSVLLFFHCPYLDMLDEFDQDINSLQISETLKEHHKDLSMMHFNTQSMVSAFKEFQVFISMSRAFNGYCHNERNVVAD